MVKWSELTKELYKPGELGKLLGLSRKTIFTYTQNERIKSVKTETGRYLYPKEEVARMLDELGMFYDDRNEQRVDVIYARVPTREQKKWGELDRQVVLILEKAGSLNNPVILKEVGSGINDRRRQFNKLIDMIENNEVGKVFVRFKHSLARFGFDMIEKIAKLHGTEIVVVDNKPGTKYRVEGLFDDIKSLIDSDSKDAQKLRGLLKKELEED